MGSGGRLAGSTSGLGELLRSFQPTPHCLEVSQRPRQRKRLAQGHTASEVMELGWNHMFGRRLGERCLLLSGHFE